MCICKYIWWDRINDIRMMLTWFDRYACMKKKKRIRTKDCMMSFTLCLSLSLSFFLYVYIYYLMRRLDHPIMFRKTFGTLIFLSLYNDYFPFFLFASVMYGYIQRGKKKRREDLLMEIYGCLLWLDESWFGDLICFCCHACLLTCYQEIE
jgi:hypothetical protein